MTSAPMPFVAPRFWNPEAKAWLSTRADPGPNPAPNQPFVPVQRPQWRLTIESIRDVTPQMRRFRFSSPGLEGFSHEPAADFTFFIPQKEGDPARRHYTARGFDPEARLLDVDIVMHGEGPGVRWAETAKVGESLDVTGPVIRRTIDPQADWYLFAGDETALPAIFGLAESLPARASAIAYLEVPEPSEKQPLQSSATVSDSWVYRGELPGNESSVLVDAVLAGSLPSEGRGQAFLFGETSRMRELRSALLARGGLERDQIFAMGYWRPGRFGGDEMIRD